MNGQCNYKDPPSYWSLFNGSVIGFPKKVNNSSNEKRKKIREFVDMRYIMLTLFVLASIVIVLLMKPKTKCDNSKGSAKAISPEATKDKEIKDAMVSINEFHKVNGSYNNNIFIGGNPNGDSVVITREKFVCEGSIKVENAIKKEKILADHPFFSKFQAEIYKSWSGIFFFSYSTNHDLQFRLPDIFDPFKSTFLSSQSLVRQSISISLIPNDIFSFSFNSQNNLAKFVLKKKYVNHLYKFLIKKILSQNSFNIDFIEWLMNSNFTDSIEYISESVYGLKAEKNICTRADQLFDLTKCLQGQVESFKENGNVDNLSKVITFKKYDCQRFSPIVNDQNLELVSKKNLVSYSRTILNKLSQNILKFANKKNQTLLKLRLWKLKYTYAKYRRSSSFPFPKRVASNDPLTLSERYKVDGIFTNDQFPIKLSALMNDHVNNPISLKHYMVIFSLNHRGRYIKRIHTILKCDNQYIFNQKISFESSEEIEKYNQNGLKDMKAQLFKDRDEINYFKADQANHLLELLELQNEGSNAKVSRIMRSSGEPILIIIDFESKSF